MNASAEPPDGVRPLRVDRILRSLPELEGLAPFVSALLAGSRPDPSRRWSGSGELGTVGDRIVDVEALEEEIAERRAEEEARVRLRLERATGVVAALAAGEAARAVDLLLEQADDEERAGDLRGAEAWAMAAHTLAREEGAGRGAEALRRAARAARGRGQAADAASRYETAYREAELRGEDADATVAAIGRGNVAVDEGRWDVAERWYQRALDLLERDGEAAEGGEAAVWQLCQNLAIVARRRGELAEARRWLERAEREAPRPLSGRARVEIGNGWGQLLLAEGLAHEAEHRLRDALAHAEDPRARVVVAVNLGEALLAQGRTLEAGERAREAEREALSGRVLNRLPEVYRLLARVAEARRAADAFVFLDRALELAREPYPAPFEEALTLEDWGRLRIREGEHERGRDALRRAAGILRDLGMESRARALEHEANDGAEPGGSGPDPERE